MLSPKEAARRACLELLPQREPAVAARGKMAERFRGLDDYRRAATLFVTPEETLRQLRINCLLDGKKLLMPAPGLKSGFYLFLPGTVPFKDLPGAVIPRGLARFGRCLGNDETAALTVDLLATVMVAADKKGGRLGDGSGFFDLAGGVLRELGCLGPATPVWGVAGREQMVEELPPLDPWDIPLSGVVTPEEILRLDRAPWPAPGIHWDRLPPHRLRKMTPLWQLYRHRSRS